MEQDPFQARGARDDRLCHVVVVPDGDPEVRGPGRSGVEVRAQEDDRRTPGAQRVDAILQPHVGRSEIAERQVGEVVVVVRDQCVQLGEVRGPQDVELQLRRHPIEGRRGPVCVHDQVANTIVVAVAARHSRRLAHHVEERPVDQDLVVAARVDGRRAPWVAEPCEHQRFSPRFTEVTAVRVAPVRADQRRRHDLGEREQVDPVVRGRGEAEILRVAGAIDLHHVAQFLEAVEVGVGEYRGSAGIQMSGQRLEQRRGEHEAGDVDDHDVPFFPGLEFDQEPRQIPGVDHLEAETIRSVERLGDAVGVVQDEDGLSGDGRGEEKRSQQGRDQGASMHVNGSIGGFEQGV